MRDVGRDERGAVAVMIGILLVSMIGFGALAIDVGALVQERRELQNGAEAAALAVAKDCAGGVTCGAFDATADDYANVNSDDGNSDVEEICGTGPGLSACASPPTVCSSPPPGTPPCVPTGTEYVKVTTVTQTGSGSQIPPFLAQVLIPGYTGTTVRMSAVAAWGPGTVTNLPAAIPLTFALCEFNAATATGTSFPTSPPTYLYFHGNDYVAPGCGPPTPPGGDFAGGFGWLNDGNDCKVDLTAGDMAPAQTGVPNPQSHCPLDEWQDATVLLPIWDSHTGTDSPGGNGEYHIVGFGAFHITGYKFSGGGSGVWGSGFGNCPAGPGGSARCIRGYFTKFVAIGQLGSGGGQPFGAVVVKMVG